MSPQRYIGVFEQLFLVRTLPPWSNNALSRLIKTPKLHFLDSGLLAALRNLMPERLAAVRTPFGAVLESFVFDEVLKLTAWDTDRSAISHLRDKSGDEVDIVMENRAGDVVGVEIKAFATVRGGDFNGLCKLRSAVGDRFKFGAVLYAYADSVPFW